MGDNDVLISFSLYEKTVAREENTYTAIGNLIDGGQAGGRVLAGNNGAGGDHAGEGSDDGDGELHFERLVFGVG